MIGLFTADWSKDMSRPFFARSKIYHQIVSKSEEMFVFSPQMINFQTKQVRGMFGIPNGWHTKLVPFPNVIYERTINRTQEERTRDLVAKMKPSVRFNQGFFNKLDVYKWLRNTRVSRILPYTTSDPLALEHMLSWYGTVYMKPINGSFGRGIKKLTRYRRPPRGVIFQQAIDLIRVKGNIVDFRVHVAKDETMKWKIITIAGKRAGNDQITTHFKNGGQPIAKEQVLSQTQIKQITMAAIDVAEELDKKVHPLGELGLDMGVDTKGDIWLFEANSKPGFDALNEQERDYLAECISGYAMGLLQCQK